MLTLGVVAPKSDLRCLICRAWCFTLSVWMKWRWEMARYILKTPLPRQWCVQSTRQLWFLSFSYLVYSRNYIFLWHLNVCIFFTKTTWNNMSQEHKSGNSANGTAAYLITSVCLPRLLQSFSQYLQMKYVTLDLKSSLKSLEYIYSTSQQYGSKL